ncbi:hypothetical protein MASR1M36_08990 [Candidatus Cloacimonadaceae bacterium]
MYPIFSYGSPRFSLGNLSVHFNEKNPAGRVEFDPQEEFFETLSGDSIPRFKGYRVKVILKLWNLRAQDYLAHLTLMNIINTSRATRMPILLQPRFSSGTTLNLYVFAKDKFGYDEITNLNAGQSIDLNFESKSLVSALPLIVSTPCFLKLNANDYLLLSSSGDKLILPEGNHVDVDTGMEESFE